MSKRPAISKSLAPDVFMQYYYLKEELVAFCRSNNLTSSGSKWELTCRIEHYLRTGKAIVLDKSPLVRYTVSNQELKLDSIVEFPFKCTQKHRSFFQKHIGKGFRFGVAFQDYLKNDEVKTYGDAIEAWHCIETERKLKKGKTQISKQFEYNTYIRDFFSANCGKSLEQAIKCWRYKKGLAGNNVYEDDDLQALVITNK